MYNLKLAFTRRLLFTAYWIFAWVMPLIYLYINLDKVTYQDVKVRFWVMLFLIIYLIVAYKSLKRYVNNLRSGILKRLFNSANILIFVGILYLLTSIIARAFIGVERFFYYFTLFEIFGFICYNADSIINDTWIREKEYERLGYDEAKKEYYKRKYMAEFENKEMRW